MNYYSSGVLVIGVFWSSISFSKIIKLPSSNPAIKLVSEPGSHLIHMTTYLWIAPARFSLLYLPEIGEKQRISPVLNPNGSTRNQIKYIRTIKPITAFMESLVTKFTSWHVTYASFIYREDRGLYINNQDKSKNPKVG